MTENLRIQIAKQLAVSNDGMENTWQDFLQDADICLQIVKDRVSPLLAKKSEANLRLSLGDTLGLKITFAPTSNDHEREVRSEMSTRIPVRRRTVRRRSSAGNQVYEVRYGSQSVFRAPPQPIRALPNRTNSDSIPSTQDLK